MQFGTAKIKGNKTKGHLINVNSYTFPEFICALTTLVALSFQAEMCLSKEASFIKCIV